MKRQHAFRVYRHDDSSQPLPLACKFRISNEREATVGKDNGILENACFRSSNRSTLTAENIDHQIYDNCGQLDRFCSGNP